MRNPLKQTSLPRIKASGRRKTKIILLRPMLQASL